MRCYINQHNLLTSDKCLEKLFILMNSPEYHPAGREEALKTCNELHIHISTPKEKPLSHGDCRACEETNNLLQSKCICEITFT